MHDAERATHINVVQTQVDVEGVYDDVCAIFDAEQVREVLTATPAL